MPISIICSECKKKLNAPDTAAGKKIRCPACKAVIAVAEQEELVEPDDELVEPDEESYVTEAPRQPKIMPPAPPPRSEEDAGGYGLDEHDADERQRRKRQIRREREDDEYFREHRRRGRKQPHRGVLVLILGIASLPGSCICAFAGWALASAALRIANEDLPKMDRGLMDADGYAMIVAGKVCAYIGIVLGFLVIISNIAFIVAKSAK